MAERMIASFTTAPHFYLHAEVNARRLLALRQELLPVLEAGGGLRLTITDLLVLICARALASHPRVMAQYTPEGLRPAPGVHLGIATDTPNGLVVPVIHDADRLALADLIRRRPNWSSAPAPIAAAGLRCRRLHPGATWETSRRSSDAILNPPQAAILAVGRIVERPFVEDGQIRPVPTARLSLSIDHRVLDGAGAARFLDDVVSLLEAPAQALARPA
jgi:pyruvate dehydrogenase E2 component (dihydrolipoamide acetyltransferase)